MGRAASSGARSVVSIARRPSARYSCASRSASSGRRRRGAGGARRRDLQARAVVVVGGPKEKVSRIAGAGGGRQPLFRVVVALARGPTHRRAVGVSSDVRWVPGCLIRGGETPHPWGGGGKKAVSLGL